MMNGHSKATPNIPMSLAYILLCLTLVSLHLCGGLYARYTSTGGGNDSARVAEFNISEEGECLSQEFKLETVPGKTEWTIQVSNRSEVAVPYTVTLENLTKNIPYVFSVNGETALIKDKCSVVCYLEPDSDKLITLAADWDAEGALQYAGMVDLIKLTIVAQQAD